MPVEEILTTVQQLLTTNVYVSAFIVLAVFFILSKFVVAILGRILLRLTSHTKTDIDSQIVKALKNPTSWVILLIGVKLFVLEIWMNYDFVITLERLINSAIIIIVALTIMKIINIIVDEWILQILKETDSHLDQQLVRLFSQIINVVGYVIMILMILALWGIQIGPLLAGLGIGGLAVAFALQPTLANIFGGVSLILDKTFKVGDIVKLDSGESGTIFEIGIRSTRIKTWNNEILVVPNSVLVNSKIMNINQPNRTIRVEIPFGVAYGSKIDEVKKVALGCLKKVEHVLDDPAPMVMFNEMADSSLNFVLRYHVDDLSHKWPTHQIVIEKLYNTLNKKKINIPFPQRELWVHNLKK
ncbi:MAG: mechanosensitive ion channel family protein [Candidatus Woesearchaeota archaeon]